MKRENKIEGLQISQLEAELKREKHKHRYRTVLKSTISTCAWKTPKLQSIWAP